MSSDKKKYPECFPDDFETKILPKGAERKNRSVYRIMKYGKIDRDGFISTFEEIQRGLITPKKTMNLNDPGIYSTSCCMDYKDVEYLLQIMMRHHPEAFVVKGETDGECGLSQITSEREPKTSNRNKSHVDWWVYENSNPHLHFDKEIEDV